MFDGGGAGASGDKFKGGPFSEILNALGIKPKGYRDRNMQSRMGMAEESMGYAPRSSGYTTPRPEEAPKGPPLGSQPGAPTAITLGQGPRMPPNMPTSVPANLPTTLGRMPRTDYTDLFMGDILAAPLGTATGDERAAPLMTMPDGRVFPAMAATPTMPEDYQTVAEMNLRAPRRAAPSGNVYTADQLALRNYLGM